MIFVTLQIYRFSMMIRVVFIACFCLLSVFAVQAQRVLKTSIDTTNKADTNHTHVKVSVIDPNGKQAVRYSGTTMRADSVQQALKMNLILITRGEYSVFYEYRLSDAFSFEAGAGVTYTDYVYELFVNEGRFIFYDDEGRYTRFLSGFAGHALLRYYPSRYETAISGMYFTPEISRRTWQMQYNVPLGFISEPHRLKRSWTEFKLQWGYQNADPYENVFWEWFVSAGARFSNEDRVRNSGAEAQFWTKQDAGFTFGIGLKIGLTL
jgi:hypothetical protein